MRTKVLSSWQKDSQSHFAEVETSQSSILRECQTKSTYSSCAEMCHMVHLLRFSTNVDQEGDTVMLSAQYQSQFTQSLLLFVSNSSLPALHASSDCIVNVVPVSDPVGPQIYATFDPFLHFNWAQSARTIDSRGTHRTRREIQARREGSRQQWPRIGGIENTNRGLR